MKKIILITFLSFFISSVSYSKIEKTKLGFSIDVPLDFILLSRDNYSEFKTLLIRSFTKEIKKEEKDISIIQRWAIGFVAWKKLIATFNPHYHFSLPIQQ